MIFDGFSLSWAGECSAWECDELGHMNMRHYVHKADEARRSFLIQLGLSHAFRSGTASSTRVTDFHIKYQGEARPGNPLRIDSAVLSLEDTQVRLCHIMTHRDGRIAATMVETVAHIYLPDDRTFPWPKRFRAAAKDHIAPLPAPAKARNVSGDLNHIGMNRAALEKAGASVIGAGVFGPSEIDATRHVTMGAMFGRTTSTVAWFREGWPEFEDPAYQAGGMSAALLEMRAVMHRWPERGDAYIYVPALIGANAYTREFVHNLLDPVTGESWCSMQASGCKFDLGARKLVKATPEDIALLESGMTPGVVA
jgi:acyl-CoA thioester hydrolase